MASGLTTEGSGKGHPGHARRSHLKVVRSIGARCCAGQRSSALAAGGTRAVPWTPVSQACDAESAGAGPRAPAWGPEGQRGL